MLIESAESRARIDYLQRVGAWQDMARRLAHEIKNPLTPILLAVEECHSRYPRSASPSEDPDTARFSRLLDTTQEIVREEIGTLRRLVGEFSAFARLPRAELVPAHVEALLADAAPTLENLGSASAFGPTGQSALVGDAAPSSSRPSRPVRVDVDPVLHRGSVAPPSVGELAVDRQLLRKALDNLVRNAVQAIRGAKSGGNVRVSATALADGRIAIDVDDDGPGVPEAARERVFDPYFTTRTEGTGLGLAIVKKVVVEHAGSIACSTSPLGGARFRIVLPPLDGAEAQAALEESSRARPDGGADETIASTGEDA
jgi:nitrogen fixation/metabolism regulation signal transduction histidine kinase